MALNLSGCPNGCPGCHSPHLQEDIGETLDETLLSRLVEVYGSSVTCICFMGGDASVGEVEDLAVLVRVLSGGKLKTGWYSGRPHVPGNIDIGKFDYIKTGPYVEELGGLDSISTNQRFYRIDGGRMLDMTEEFQKSL